MNTMNWLKSNGILTGRFSKYVTSCIKVLCEYSLSGILSAKCNIWTKDKKKPPFNDSDCTVGESVRTGNPCLRRRASKQLLSNALGFHVLLFNKVRRRIKLTV